MRGLNGAGAKHARSRSTSKRDRWTGSSALNDSGLGSNAQAGSRSARGSCTARSFGPHLSSDEHIGTSRNSWQSTPCCRCSLGIAASRRGSVVSRHLEGQMGRPHGIPQQWVRQPLTRQPASPRKPGPVSMMTTRPRPGLAILAQGWKLAQAPRTGWLWKTRSICTELQCCSGKKNSAGDPLSHSSGMVCLRLT